MRHGSIHQKRQKIGPREWKDFNTQDSKYNSDARLQYTRLKIQSEKQDYNTQDLGERERAFHTA